ncbi:MAG: hypothetical protein AYK18_01205 [Theionarchaea archaeon DG-70]|nr:MAG: hypothetical protein AYK18_01205 [Theionarchaea archaeon DG-70]
MNIQLTDALVADYSCRKLLLQEGYLVFAAALCDILYLFPLEIVLKQSEFLKTFIWIDSTTCQVTI